MKFVILSILGIASMCGRMNLVYENEKTNKELALRIREEVNKRIEQGNEEMKRKFYKIQKQCDGNNVNLGNGILQINKWNNCGNNVIIKSQLKDKTFIPASPTLIPQITPKFDQPVFSPQPFPSTIPVLQPLTQVTPIKYTPPPILSFPLPPQPSSLLPLSPSQPSFSSTIQIITDNSKPVPYQTIIQTLPIASPISSQHNIIPSPVPITLQLPPTPISIISPITIH